MDPLNEAELAALRALDTPTVCNALEVVAPDRRGGGYSVEPFFCPRPELQPIVGYARTGTIRAMQPSDRTPAEDTDARLDYYDHVAEGPGPTITVIEDLDAVPGYGAWWGEVNTNIHKGLGSLGVITNGSIRDLDDAAAGFQMLAGMANPSHAWVRVVSHGVPVTVHGLTINPGDLVHADRHGAVVIPHEVATQLPEAAAKIAAQERRVITAAQQGDFSAAKLREMLGGRTGH
ncbi:MAG: RraA family protein [Acidimicrobiia bacterium]|nr:RraA family protein [Acidimicrobiia bacterium]